MSDSRKMKSPVTPRNVFLFVFFALLSPLANCFCLKAGIGSGAYSAVTKTLSPLIGLKIGTIGAIFNIMCIIGEWIILKKDFGMRHFLQFFMAIVTGWVTNFFYYDLLGSFAPTNYLFRVFLLVAGDFVNSLAVAALLNLDFVSTPLGGFCNVFSNHLKKPYAFSRQGVDIICLIIILVCVFFFHGELSIREGTIISALEFGPFVDFWLKRSNIIIEKKESIS